MYQHRCTASCPSSCARAAEDALEIQRMRIEANAGTWEEYLAARRLPGVVCMSRTTWEKLQRPRNGTT